MRESSNIGVIKIAALLGKERLDQFQRAFGFGSKTAINFPAESAGLMKHRRHYVPSDMGSIPIGYTTAVTPMQMLDVFATVANGGVTRPPRLGLGDDRLGRRPSRLAPKRGQPSRERDDRRAAQRDAARRGHRRHRRARPRSPGYTVAGKTGTSRKPPYEPTPRYMASFAGFAPAESPRLAAIVVIDQPGTSNDQYFGGKVAAPLFSTIMQYALRLERVPPTTAMSAEASSAGPAAEASEEDSGSRRTAAARIRSRHFFGRYRCPARSVTERIPCTCTTSSTPSTCSS